MKRIAWEVPHEGKDRAAIAEAWLVSRHWLTWREALFPLACVQYPSSYNCTVPNEEVSELTETNRTERVTTMKVKNRTCIVGLTRQTSNGLGQVRVCRTLMEYVTVDKFPSLLSRASFDSHLVHVPQPAGPMLISNVASCLMIA